MLLEGGIGKPEVVHQRHEVPLPGQEPDLFRAGAFPPGPGEHVGAQVKPDDRSCVTSLAEKDRKGRRSGREVENAGVRAEPLRVRHETPFPAAVLAEGEGPRQDVVAGRDPAKNRFGVTDPLAGVGRPGFEPGRQIANQYVILARTLFSASVPNMLLSRISLLKLPGEPGWKSRRSNCSRPWVQTR